LRTLADGREREIAVGATQWGPHRDDLVFLLDGRSAAAYASRAQARTAALSLRLAEARFLLAGSGDHPVLLLDDVLSEMDDSRRRGVLAAIEGFDQVWVTSAERGRSGVVARREGIRGQGRRSVPVGVRLKRRRLEERPLKPAGEHDG
jgi:DNA replication and repair protein RecF